MTEVGAGHASGSHNTGDARSGDPLGELAAALSSACALGSAMLGSLSGQPDLGHAAAAFAPFIEPFRRSVGTIDAGTDGPEDTSIAQEMADMAGFLAQTWMVAAASGFRYWRRLAEMYGQHQSDLVRAFA